MWQEICLAATAYLYNWKGNVRRCLLDFILTQYRKEETLECYSILANENQIIFKVILPWVDRFSLKPLYFPSPFWLRKWVNPLTHCGLNVRKSWPCVIIWLLILNCFTAHTVFITCDKECIDVFVDGYLMGVGNTYNNWTVATGLMIPNRTKVVICLSLVYRGYPEREMSMCEVRKYGQKVALYTFIYFIRLGVVECEFITGPKRVQIWERVALFRTRLSSFYQLTVSQKVWVVFTQI